MNCWICGNIADSMEHKFKSSDLKKAFEFDSDNKVLFQTDSKYLEIRGKNSKLVKFEKTICRTCNGATTQVHDLSYDFFVDHIMYKSEILMEIKTIDLEDIYGGNWRKEYDNLTKYISKHIGCILAQSQLNLDIEILKTNILTDAISKGVLLKFQIRQGTNFLLKHFISNNNGNMYFHGDAGQIKFEGDKWVLHGWISINEVSIHWFYSPFLKFDSSIPSNLIQLDFQQLDFEGAEEDCDKLLWFQMDGIRSDEERIMFVHNAIKEYR